MSRILKCHPGIGDKTEGIVLCANIAPYKEDREFNRKLIESTGGKYVEIYVNTKLEVCEQRDVKGLYKLAREGIIKEFTGISDPFDIPENPEVDTLDKTNEMILDEILNL